MTEHHTESSPPLRTINTLLAEAAHIREANSADPRFAEIVEGHMQDSLIIAQAIRTGTIDLVSGAELIAVRQAQAEKDGIIDPMTGLYRKEAFELRLEAELARARRDGTTTAIGYVDLDDFSLVNNEESHEHGHATLEELGKVLRTSIRASDIAGRCGGEEIVIALTNTSEEDAVARFNQIREGLSGNIAQALTRRGKPIDRTITASIGVAAIHFPNPHDANPTAIDMRNILELADQRMRMAKIMGKNQIVGTDGEAAFRRDARLVSIGRTGKYRIH